MRTVFILAVVVITSTGGELSLAHAMKRLGEANSFSPLAILRFIGRALLEGWLWLGIGLLAVSFYAFLAMLSWYPVGFVVPATSLSYVAGAVGAKFLLGERLSAARWAGIVLICCGVALSWIDHLPAIPAASDAYSLLRGAIFVLAAVPLLLYLFAAWAAWRFFAAARRSRPALPSGVFAPPVSILKPIRGLDRGAYDNFASFCRQDYPQYEILFAAGDEHDAAVPVIRKLMADFPQLPIRLLIGVELTGANDKVAKLCRLAREARYSFLVITDSDVRVEPDYLHAVIAPFADERVGMVTALYRAADAPAAEMSFGAVMDAAGSAGSFASSALIARSLEGLKFAMGSTMATTRERLAEIGGFEGLLDLHSDDYELGRRIAARGYQIELASEPVDMQFPSETFGGYLRHELRWLVGIRHIRPGGHFGMLMTHGLVWATAAALISPTGSAAAIWLCAYIAVRMVSGYMVGVWGLRDPVLRRKLWLLPLHDFFMFFAWMASFAVNRIEWRGLVFTLEKGRMIPVAPRQD